MKNDYRVMKLNAILGRDYWQTNMKKASDYRIKQYQVTLRRIQQEIKRLDNSFGTLLPWQDGRDQNFRLIHKLGCC